MSSFLTDIKQARDLINLWKSSLQMEEAMQMNLTPVAPNVAQLEGRFYSKLDLRQDNSKLKSFLLRKTGKLELELNQEILPLLKNLSQQDAKLKKYRLPLEHEFLIGFPSFFYTGKYGKERLAVPFKFPLSQVVYPDFHLITPGEIQQNTFLERNKLTLRQELTNEDNTGPSYWIDEFFFQEELGISAEELTDFRKKSKEDKLSLEESLQLFCRHLLYPGEETELNSEKNIFLQLIGGFQKRLAKNKAEYFKAESNCRVFPFALLYELESNQPTRQLQNDLDEIVTEGFYKQINERNPAYYYLLGNNKEDKQDKNYLGQCQPEDLTPSQKHAILSVNNRRFTAIAGPPGTGKTHLIRNLFAERIVHHATLLNNSVEMIWLNKWISVVASTNNRAVDNALEGMEFPGMLPVTLRAGSRIMLAQSTVPFLQDYCSQLNARKKSREVKRFIQLKKELRGLIDDFHSADENGSVTKPDPYSLYMVAREVIDAWAGANAEPIQETLKVFCTEITERKALRTLRNPKSRALIQTIFPVIGSTLLSIRNFFPLDEGQFGLLIVDEAGQCSPSYILPSLFRSRKAVLIGDTRQLEPVSKVRFQDLKELVNTRNIKLPTEIVQNFSTCSEALRSAQHIAQDACKNSIELREHFRCQPEIINISMDLCGYDLEVRTVDLPQEQELLSHSLHYFDIQQPEERYGDSWCNRIEVNLIIKLVSDLLENGAAPEDIAILTPYRGQMSHLNYALHKAGISHLNGEENPDQQNSIATGTVHRFQGGERKIVIFSHVISNRSPQFLNSRVNLLNVAISRAKNHFIFVGSMTALDRGIYTRCLKEHLEKKGKPLSGL